VKKRLFYKGFDRLSGSHQVSKYRFRDCFSSPIFFDRPVAETRIFIGFLAFSGKRKEPALDLAGPQ
jgi:hypothetical protein